jgi:putative membrane-bound dehydrogenase-like protein
MNSLLLAVALSLLSADPKLPTVHDDRLEISLFAAEPQVTTPTGIAVDQQGIVYVVENNTHFRPKDYDRPELDRILRMQDTDGDGRADQIEEFYTGLRNTMSLEFERDGALLVATRSEIFRLRDKDGDGRADERIDLIKLDTKGSYPHNGLAGFALDFRGNIYFGFGENLGVDYKISGTDGKFLTGGGEGGNVYCCSPEGKNLRLVATGFWNPFHLTFDAFGRLFTVDNDPDSRPPCRLLHVVDGGDYGFRFRNGRKGISPFTAWNGELPATLPMVAGTGEAPCAVMAYESDHLPDEYRGELLVTSWGDHRLERYTLKPRGASFVATMKPVVTGDQNFRPVGLAMAPDGSLYMSDWVDKSYPIHGKGRIWHLKAKKPKVREKLSDDPAIALAHPHRPWREEAARKLSRHQAQQLVKESKDERVVHLAANRVREIESAESPSKEELLSEYQRIMNSPDFARDPWLQVRAYQMQVQGVAPLPSLDDAQLSPLSIWRAADLQRNDSPDSRPFAEQFLRSSHPDLRFIGIRWAAESKLQELAPALEKLLEKEADNSRNFAAILVALDRISGRTHENTGEYFAAKFLIGSSKNVPAKIMALRMVSPNHPDLTVKFLIELTKHEDQTLQREAVRTLRLRGGEEAISRLREIVKDAQADEQFRCEALLGLSVTNDEDRFEMKRLLGIPQQRLLVAEALRMFVGTEANHDEKVKITLAGIDGPDDMVKRVLEPKNMPPAPPAADIAAWQKRAVGEGDPTVGERLFFHPKVASCFKCHEYKGRGGKIGPDLSTVAKSMTRERLLQSIVDPSREIAPQFTPWIIQATDGTVKTGVYVGEEVDGTMRYADSEGKIFKLHPRDVEDKKPSNQSIMPEGLAAQLTPQELRDLLAFLMQP